MKRIFSYFLLVQLLYGSIGLAMHSSLANTSSPSLQTTNGTISFQPHWVTTFPIRVSEDSLTKKRAIKKSFIPVASKDVGQILLDDAYRQTDCDIKKHIPFIRDHIDARWGLHKDSWFRSIRGTLWSKKDAGHMSAENAINELGTIESLIPSLCYSGLFFTELENQHRYVYYLIHNVAKSEAEKFWQVNGSTIDNVMNEEKQISGISLPLSRFINIRAKYRFLYEQYTISFGEDINVKKLSSYDARICSRAFSRSKHSIEELEALKNSQTMKSCALQKWAINLYAGIEIILEKLKRTEDINS